MSEFFKRNRCLLLFICLVSHSAARADEAPAIPAAKNDGWTFVAEIRAVKIYSRLRAGSAHKEFKATGAIAAPSAQVHRVLNDVGEYPRFMPYTVECRLVRRAGAAVIEYQRISPPLCSDRDYTLRIESTSRAGKDGVVYRQEWTPANAEGPAEKPGVVRVKVCEGSWLLEPRGANATMATYSIFTDSGGALPAFLANRGSQIAIPRLFEAIRKQVKNPKYAAATR